MDSLVLVRRDSVEPTNSNHQRRQFNTPDIATPPRCWRALPGQDSLERIAIFDGSFRRDANHDGNRVIEIEAQSDRTCVGIAVSRKQSTLNLDFFIFRCAEKVNVIRQDYIRTDQPRVRLGPSVNERIVIESLRECRGSVQFANG
jgi:hypothetical protein